MTESKDERIQRIPVTLDANSPPADFPSARHLYLLLHTRALENWAYRPSPPDAVVMSAVAPSVGEMVREISPLSMRRWLWEGISHEPERGPLLVDATDELPLLAHAKSVWAPADGVMIIGANAGMDELHQHLTGLVRLTMPDSGEARFAFGPSQLCGWLNSLDADHRHAWLGPMSQLLWRDNLGPAHQWYRLEQTEPAPAQRSGGWLHLRPRELSAFDHNMREHFIISLTNELKAVSEYVQLDLMQLQNSVRNTLDQGSAINIRAEEDLRNYVLLRARHPELRNDFEAQRLLNDLNEPPSARLRAVAALVEKKDL